MNTHPNPQASETKTSETKAKVAIVTGGSRGIGAAVVQNLKHADWRVAAIATSEARLQTSPADLKLVCDVTDLAQVKATLQRIVETYGHIDALINSAGIAGSNPLEPESDDDLWHCIVNVNLHGTYYLSKYALPYLVEGSRIINIASVLGLKGVPDQTAYCAAKHAVVGFTKSLALYTAPRRITVNAICPGWVQTDMAEARFIELGLTPVDVMQTIPLGRIIQPHEVASLVMFLLSEAAANLTGQALVLDAGATL
ncbi:SDR family NAD(P)-dependent oxidoreductase [Trichothermofontia sp.]